jgi:hypothetical protein
MSWYGDRLLSGAVARPGVHLSRRARSGGCRRKEQFEDSTGTEQVAQRCTEDRLISSSTRTSPRIWPKSCQRVTPRWRRAAADIDPSPLAAFQQRARATAARRTGRRWVGRHVGMRKGRGAHARSELPVGRDTRAAARHPELLLHLPSMTACVTTPPGCVERATTDRRFESWLRVV